MENFICSIWFERMNELLLYVLRLVYGRLYMM